MRDCCHPSRLPPGSSPGSHLRMTSAFVAALRPLLQGRQRRRRVPLPSAPGGGFLYSPPPARSIADAPRRRSSMLRTAAEGRLFGEGLGVGVVQQIRSKNSPPTRRHFVAPPSPPTGGRVGANVTIGAISMCSEMCASPARRRGAERAVPTWIIRHRNIGDPPPGTIP
jgi:hypothetical protein